MDFASVKLEQAAVDAGSGSTTISSRIGRVGAGRVGTSKVGHVGTGSGPGSGTGSESSIVASGKPLKSPGFGNFDSWITGGGQACSFVNRSRKSSSSSSSLKIRFIV